MTFWSGPTLQSRGSALFQPFDPSLVDGAAYTLSLGDEIYVTPTDKASNPRTVSLTKLPEKGAIAIPPGQFAYLTTAEIIRVPTDALALISIRAKVKWKGLVNVSGFHVDPGYWGRLTYTVFNAGPAPIHLRQGDGIFLIWFAQLDADSADFAKKPVKPVEQMDVSILNHVSGELHSLEGLADKIRSTEKELRDRIAGIERENGIIKVAAGALITITIAIVGRWIWETAHLEPAQPPPQTTAITVAPPASPTQLSQPPHVP